jgi:hypothetical protein
LPRSDVAGDNAKMHRLPFTDLIALAGALVDIAKKRKPKPGKPRKPPKKRKPRPGDGLLAFFFS